MPGKRTAAQVETLIKARAARSEYLKNPVYRAAFCAQRKEAIANSVSLAAHRAAVSARAIENRRHPPDVLRCTGCQLPKPLLSSFPKNKKARYGYGPQCNDCAVQRSRKWDAEHPKKKLLRVRKCYLVHKYGPFVQEAIQYLERPASGPSFSKRWQLWARQAVGLHARLPVATIDTSLNLGEAGLTEGADVVL